MLLQKNCFYFNPVTVRDFTGRALLQKGVSLIFRAPFELNASGFYTISSLQTPLYAGDPVENLVESLQQKVRLQIAGALASFEPQFLRIAREVEAINEDPTLSTEEKQKKIHGVSERYGIRKDDMKKHVTEPLEKIYAEAKDRLGREVDFLKKDRERIESYYGKDSPQALQAARTLDRVVGALEPFRQKIEQSQETYHGMYPKAGCFKKVAKGFGGIFKGVAHTLANAVKGLVNPKNWLRADFWRNVVAPIALNLIPGIGLASSVAWKWGRLAYGAFQTVKSLAQKSWKGALEGVVGIATRVSAAFTGKIAAWVQKGTAWVSRARERIDTVLHPQKWIQEKIFGRTG